MQEYKISETDTGEGNAVIKKSETGTGEGNAGIQEI